MPPIQEFVQFTWKFLATALFIIIAFYGLWCLWEYDPNATKGVQAETFFVKSDMFPSSTPDQEVYLNLLEYIKQTKAIVHNEISNAKMDQGTYVEGEGKKQFVISVIKY